MAWFTALKTARNLSPIFVRSRFHPCQYAVEVSGQAVQQAGFAHERLRDVEDLRDGGQFLVEHAGESEQIVALVSQRDAHRADAPCILRLETLQFIGDEVKQLSPCAQVRSGQRQNVVAQPLDEGADTTGQFTHSGLGLACQRQFGDERVLRIRLIRTADLGFQVSRRDLAPLAMRDSVLARPSHWWMM
jgi:hypothetical protein